MKVRALQLHLYFCNFDQFKFLAFSHYSKATITYWLAIVFSNSLGTAFGDFLTSNLGLSYVQGAFVTASVIGVVIALHYLTKLSDVFLFWLAFIFTRPFGATFGDFLTKPVKDGGLSLPREYASAIAFILLAVVLFFSTQKEKKVRYSIDTRE